MNEAKVDGRAAPVTRWALITLPILAFILVPFFLFGGRMDGWATTLLEQRAKAAFAFLVVVLLLVSDVALPIPSSVVSTMAGAILGAPAGAFASWLGMTVGAMAGYALGAFAGRPFIVRLTGLAPLTDLERDMTRYGAGLVAAGRAVPVLAEATTLIAGASRMPFPRFIGVAAAANLAISIVYAAVGALSVQVESFLLAVVGSMLLPAIAWWLVRKLRSKTT